MSTERHDSGAQDEGLAPDPALDRALPPVEDPAAADLDALFQRLEGAVEAERGVRAWLCSRSTAVRWTAAAGLIVAIVAAELAMKPRVDLGVYPALRMGVALGAMGVLAFLALGVGLRPLQRPAAPPWLTAAVLGLGAAIPAFLAGLPAAHLDHAASLAGAGADFVPRAFACFGFGAVIGVPVVLLLLLLDRGGHVGPWRAAAAALAAALAANLALQVHCPIVHPTHLLVGHASLAVVYPALYVAVSRLVVARQRAAAADIGPWPRP